MRGERWEGGQLAVGVEGTSQATGRLDGGYSHNDLLCSNLKFETTLIDHM